MYSNLTILYCVFSIIGYNVATVHKPYRYLAAIIGHHKGSRTILKSEQKIAIRCIHMTDKFCFCLQVFLLYFLAIQFPKYSLWSTNKQIQTIEHHIYLMMSTLKNKKGHRKILVFFCIATYMTYDIVWIQYNSLGERHNICSFFYYSKKNLWQTKIYFE